MTTTFLNLILITSFLISSGLTAQNLDYIRFLLTRSEYSIARTHLYKLLYSVESEKDRATLLAEIAYTYQMEGDHKSSISIYNEITQMTSALSEGFLDSTMFNMTISFLELELFDRAFDHLKESNSEHSRLLLLRGIMMTAERGQPIETKLTEGDLSSLQELRTELKNPRLAGLLSALFPGAGQIYSAHYADGLQALLAVGAGLNFSLVALQEKSGPIITTLTIGSTLLFYYANIISGFRTAIYRNKKIKEQHVKERLLYVEPLDFLSSYNK